MATSATSTLPPSTRAALERLYRKVRTFTTFERHYATSYLGAFDPSELRKLSPEQAQELARELAAIFETIGGAR